MELKKPTIRVLVEVLETLAEQGFIDVEPTERDYDLTAIYDFLVTSGIAGRTEEKYWLQLYNEDACFMLANLLKSTGRIQRKPSRYQCLMCGEIFDTRTGKGKMHMASHGYSLKWSLREGKARPLP